MKQLDPIEFILDEYYQKHYPKPLGRQRIEIPEELKLYYPKSKTFLGFAQDILGEICGPEEALEKLKSRCSKDYHIQKDEEELSFPVCDGLVLSSYALTFFKDTHALDKGKPLRSKLDQYITKHFGTKDMTCLNIITNQVNSNVWSYQVTTNYGFSGTSLYDIDSIPLKDNKAIWIFENDNTAQRIFYKGLHFPFIIASGRPTQTFHRLIERLIENDVKLFYHGDMDLAGLDMLQKLKKKYPIESPFMNLSEYESSKKVKAPKDQEYKVDNLLATAIRNTNEVVYEEQLDLTKCYEISKAYNY